MDTLRPEQTQLQYNALKWLVVSPLLHGAFRLRIEGVEHVPARGPLVLACNHASHLDPLVLANCANRPVAFMAKEELFDIPLLGRLIRLYGAFPVRRGSGDRAALRAALLALEADWAVGVFLGGTRTEDGRIQTPQLGAALVAARAKAPLLPVAIAGTALILPKGASLPRLHAVTVRFGLPLPPPSSTERAVLQSATQECVARIHGLLETPR